MAIKINGTTVIDDSRNLSNVGGLKTVNGTSLVGSGNISAGASTTAGAVGTYAFLGGYSAGASYTGFNVAISGSNLTYSTDNGMESGSPSGTWYSRGHAAFARATVFIRIS